VAAASFIGQSEAALERTERTLAIFVPEDINVFLIDIVEDATEIIGGQQTWVILLSVLIAIYSGSRGVVALQKALARIERMEEDRSGWKVRIIGIVLTIGAGLTLIVTSLTLLVGRRVIDFLVEWTRFEGLETLWEWLRFPLVALGLFLFLYSVYRWGPPRPFPGAFWAAALSTVLVAASSLVLGVYLNEVAAANTFAVLGTFALVLLWFFLGAFVILFCGAAVGFGFRHRRKLDRPI
jgi:membrane protein